MIGPKTSMPSRTPPSLPGRLIIKVLLLITHTPLLKIAKGVLVNKTSSNAPLPVIYGQRKIGGVAIFLETSGATNEHLFMIMALCEGGVESCEKIYIDDKEVTWSGTLTDGTERTVNSSDSNFYKADPTVDGSSAESTISVTWYDGDDDQSYNTTVGALSSWTSNHRLRGVSYLALKFNWYLDCFGGIPNVKALIKGRKVYDPNLDGTNTGGSGSHRSSPWPRRSCCRQRRPCAPADAARSDSPR